MTKRIVELCVESNTLEVVYADFSHAMSCATKYFLHKGVMCISLPGPTCPKHGSLQHAHLASNYDIKSSKMASSSSLRKGKPSSSVPNTSLRLVII